MTDYDATPALLAAANETIRTLSDENRALMAANADLNAELTSLRRELDDKAWEALNRD